eukprot:scaffold177717_cov39-Tisochrysis_lutea.AAC.1
MTRVVELGRWKKPNTGSARKLRAAASRYAVPRGGKGPEVSPRRRVRTPEPLIASSTRSPRASPSAAFRAANTASASTPRSRVILEAGR